MRLFVVMELSALLADGLNTSNLKALNFQCKMHFDFIIIILVCQVKYSLLNADCLPYADVISMELWVILNCYQQINLQ